VLLGGCASASKAPPDHAALAPPAVQPTAPPQAEAIGRKVEEHARKTEKAEGKQNLVKDAVQVKPDAGGGAVVEQKGEASYYGKRFHGRKTASGKRFDAGGRTAAHPTLPLGTKARVKNLDTGKSVDVTITDRGPHAKGRDIDLSQGAAEDIGLDKKHGAAPVEIEAQVTPSPGAQPQQ
jgi:rare lipoprotein A